MQRFKTYWGQGAVDRFVERTVTPAGMSQLFTLGKAYQKHVVGAPDPSQVLPLHQRIARTWARVTRAEFMSPTRVEIDMKDKHAPNRKYACVLELRGLQWKLTELRIRTAQAATPDAL